MARSNFGSGLGINTNITGFGASRTKVLKRDERRSFNLTEKNHMWDKQKGKCAKCKETLMRSATHYDHIIPWELGGKTNVKNGKALCPNCHAKKTNKDRLKIQARKRRAKKQQQSGKYDPYLSRLSSWG